MLARLLRQIQYWRGKRPARLDWLWQMSIANYAVDIPCERTDIYIKPLHAWLARLEHSTYDKTISTYRLN